MIIAAEYGNAELLVSQPSDLLQLELSYFFDGEIITFLLHVPTVPFGAMLRLVKLHPFPLPLSGNYSIIPDVENQVLAISESDVEMYLQFPSVNLLGCNQASHVYLCEKLGALDKKATQSCLGALHVQDFEIARVLCPMKVVSSGEISFRLNNNEHLIYSPIAQTITIKCPVGSDKKKNENIYLSEGVNSFHLSPGCRTTLLDHYLFSDNSISSDSGFEHIILKGDSMLNIPHITSESLELIMERMKEEGLHSPTVNDIITTSEQIYEKNFKTSIFASIAIWIIFGSTIIFIIAFLYRLHSHLKDYFKIFLQILQLKTHKTLKTFLPHLLLYIKDQAKINPPITSTQENPQ